MNLDDALVKIYTKEEIESIVEDKFRDLMQVYEYQKELLGEQIPDLCKQIVETGAGARHRAKKEDSRAIVKACQNKDELDGWLASQHMSLESVLKFYTIEEQEDGTIIVY